MLESSIKQIFWILCWVSLAVCLPLFFIGLNVNWAFGSESVYMYSVDNFGVTEKSGIDRQELFNSAREMIKYFNYSTEISSILVDKNGHIEYLFSKQEQTHFKDVRSMLLGIKTVAWVCGSVLLFTITAFSYFTIKGANTYARSILRCFKLSAITTLGIFGSVTVVSLFGGFNYLFYWFHVLSFSNDLWMGTESSRMIQLFPSEFFMHVLIMIAVATCLEMVTVIVALQSFLKFIYMYKRRV
jgi:integral membrane protein (TIGR01906 family)